MEEAGKGRQAVRVARTELGKEKSSTSLIPEGGEKQQAQPPKAWTPSQTSSLLSDGTPEVRLTRGPGARGLVGGTNSQRPLPGTVCLYVHCRHGRYRASQIHKTHLLTDRGTQEGPQTGTGQIVHLSSPPAHDHPLIHCSQINIAYVNYIGVFGWLLCCERLLRAPFLSIHSLSPHTHMAPGEGVKKKKL